jgi:hypothetical protein
LLQKTTRPNFTQFSKEHYSEERPSPNPNSKKRIGSLKNPKKETKQTRLQNLETEKLPSSLTNQICTDLLWELITPD